MAEEKSVVGKKEPHEVLSNRLTNASGIKRGDPKILADDADEIAIILDVLFESKMPASAAHKIAEDHAVLPELLSKYGWRHLSDFAAEVLEDLRKRKDEEPEQKKEDLPQTFEELMNGEKWKDILQFLKETDRKIYVVDAEPIAGHGGGLFVDGEGFKSWSSVVGEASFYAKSGPSVRLLTTPDKILESVRECYNGDVPMPPESEIVGNILWQFEVSQKIKDAMSAIS